jgi:hypothetical protein
MLAHTHHSHDSLDTHHIRPAWPDFMVYEDGEGHAVEFDCRSLEEPPQVSVPAKEHWAAKMPPWAHPQRELIIERLRASGCVVFEEGDGLSTALSPDGSLRVAVHSIEDERMGPWIIVSVLAMPGGEVLVNESNYRASTLFRFPRLGAVDISLTDRAGQRRYFEVDGASRTFRMHPSEVREPLAQLPARLGQVAPRQALAPSPASAAANRLVNLACAFGSLLFVVGGAWITFVADTTKDRWMGVLSVVFFGACFATFWSDWRRHRGRK